MDPRTALLIAALMTLLNGAVLGVMHSSLSRDVQPSAADWRIGTLLLAGGTVLLAFQDALTPGFILTTANGALMVGIALYLRSVRRFCGIADTHWIFLPSVIGAALVYWFAEVTPSHNARVVAASLVWVGTFAATAWTLHASAGTTPYMSRRLLTGLFGTMAVFMAFRGVYFAQRSVDIPTMLDASAWINATTAFIVTILPVIGTTMFLLMCVERIRRQWELAAATDYLTGLPNRRTITGSGEARFNAAKRNGTNFSIAVIDIDHFKSINDHFGHDVGDVALKHVATTLDHACRGPHMAGRQGGEEFVVLFEEAGSDEACAAAERLREAVSAAALPLAGAQATITVSIGVSTQMAGDQSLGDLLRRADQALYAAKSSGRNRVEFGAA